MNLSTGYLRSSNAGATMTEKSKMRELRRLMALHELRAPEVAAILDVRPQTVRCYMCGLRTIPKRHLEALRRAISSPTLTTAAA
jgi:hypothetical protein